MQSYVTIVIADEKRRIMIDLPDDMPTGLIERTARGLVNLDTRSEPLTREWVQARLIAAGLADINTRYAPEDAEELSEEEEEELARRMSGGRSVEDLVNEDREERF
jgi:hypothetical protein